MINICENINDCLATLAWDPYVAVAVSRKQVLNCLAISNEEIYCFEKIQNIRSIAISMVARHRYALLTKMNRLIQNAIESGLFLKWERDSILSNQKDESDNIRYNRVIWGHFGGTMIIITAGLTISAMVFAFELFVKRMRRVHRRSKFWKVAERLIDGHRYELL